MTSIREHNYDALLRRSV